MDVCTSAGRGGRGQQRVLGREGVSNELSRGAKLQGQVLGEHLGPSGAGTEWGLGSWAGPLSPPFRQLPTILLTLMKH